MFDRVRDGRGREREKGGGETNKHIKSKNK
jgi:hypothetical protein